jgi:hypothetical protein
MDELLKCKAGEEKRRKDTLRGRNGWGEVGGRIYSWADYN